MFLKILIIEDSEDDLYFFKRTLKETGLNVEVLTAGDAVSGMEQIKQQALDCIFLDYSMPGMNGLEFLRKVRSEKITTPIIMLTGQKDEQIIVQLMKAGATDYISKNTLSSDTLRLSIESAKKIYQIRLEKAQAEEALKLSEASLSEAQRIASLGNWEYNVQLKKSKLSEEAYHILGLDKTNVPVFLKILRQVHKKDIAALKQYAKSIQAHSSYEITFRIYVNDVLKYIHVRGKTLTDHHGNIHRIVGTIQDVSLLKNALNDIEKAKIGRKATTIVFGVAIGIFILSEAIFDPFIDALETSLLIGLSFKRGLALFLKPVESFLEKFMLSKTL